jgi:hypothetical protein
LLNFQNCKAHCGNKLKTPPLEIFNQTYQICAELEKEQYPEQIVSEIWNSLRDKFPLCETNIILSCVYVILLFSKKQTQNMQFFLTCCKQQIDEAYLLEFQHLIREVLIHITAITDDIEILKKEANKISDLNERELFYAGYLAHYKQIQHKGNIVQQIIDEMVFIQQTKALTNTENESADSVNMKVKAVVILELLKEMKSGVAHNDRSKISKLIAFLTGNSYQKIYNELRNGICLTNYHSQQIDDVNKIFTELNMSISICKDKEY